MLGPSIEYAISDEVRLSAAALIPVGAKPTWTVGPGGMPEMEARSEAGLGAQVYVLTVRAST